MTGRPVPSTGDVLTARPSAAGRTAGLARWAAPAEVAGFVLLTALAAQWQVRIPGLLVPVTLQSLAVLLCGLCLSPVRSLLAMAVYLLAGSAVSASAGSAWSLFTPGSSGLPGPTGGYLAGFLVAAPVVSLIRQRWGGSLAGLAAAAAAGTAVIFASGVAWLMFFVPGPWAALQQGLIPFLPGAVVKGVVAVGAVAGWRLMRPSAVVRRLRQGRL